MTERKAGKKYLVKACPFCGCLPEIRKWHNASNGAHVGCVNDACPVEPSVTWRGFQRTVDFWNERDASGSLLGEVAVVRDE